MVTVAIGALELEYLDKILDWGRSRYIFTDSDSVHFYRLRLHQKFIPTPTPQPWYRRHVCVEFL
jgi:hypothetical protein